MPIEMGLWRMDADSPRRLTATALASEAALESYLADDPSLLGIPLLVIGRQVGTPHGKYIDLLAIDADGALHVLELKRDRTPREVVAQVLDYGSWVTTLAREEVVALANKHLNAPFEAAYARVFGDAPPDELNTELFLTVVAASIDPASERIITYLRDFGVPINAVFFSYLEDEDRRYLARAWLAADDISNPRVSPAGGKRADWNGRDWFVNCGVSPEGRHWEDCRAFGFLGADGGAVYTRTFRSIPTGARVNAYISGAGYVGVGEVLAPARRVENASVVVEGRAQPLLDVELSGTYSSTADLSDEEAHWILPVRWLGTASRNDAYWESGLFANPNVACKLRQEFTLERLARRFHVDDDASAP